MEKIDICELIKKGGIFYDVEGSTPEEVYKNVCNVVDLPEDLSGETLLKELVNREQLMSTAVGNGVAIPHPRPLLLTKPESQRIILCFSKKGLDMNAPDERLVTSLFILLTSSRQDHLEILSTLADLFQKVEVRRALEQQFPEKKLFAEIEKFQNK
ncbi:MAG: PTS sugar transporter subunit IIA [Spirochaetaceae bacterium]|nr:PTS sugar transporter subunit IIA [Spirochaetaceae bacterium]